MFVRRLFNTTVARRLTRTLQPVPALVSSMRVAQRSLFIGDDAPDFTQDSSQGKIKFHEYLGNSWGILFSHPADYTPVCTTELGEVARLADEWAKRDTKVIGLSVDALKDHHGWIDDIVATQNVPAVNYPIIADADRSVSKLYEMLAKNELDSAGMPITVRSVFIIGPDKKIKLTITYPASTGRNFNEILRVLDSLQLTSVHNVATPVNWTDGDDVIVPPSVSTEDARKKFPKGVKEIRPYLRYTPQPNK